MPLTSKQKTNLAIGITAGVLLIGGGAWAAIYFSGKDKREKSEEGGGGSGGGSGSGGGGAAVSPCVSRPASNECKKEKCSSLMATLGRGSGSSANPAQVIECKKLLGIALNPCDVRAGSNECIEWQKKQAQTATSGRGFSGINFA